MEGEDDLDILTALLGENETEEEQEGPEAVDDLDGLFDDDGEDDEEYTEGPEAEEEAPDQEEEAPDQEEEAPDQEEGAAVASDLFGDVDDIEEEEEAESQRPTGEANNSLNKSKEDLEEELRRMQEKMQQLQQQLEASQKSSGAPPAPNRTSGTPPAPNRTSGTPNRSSGTPPAPNRTSGTPNRTSGTPPAPNRTSGTPNRTSGTPNRTSGTPNRTSGTPPAPNRTSGSKTPRPKQTSKPAPSTQKVKPPSGKAVGPGRGETSKLPSPGAGTGESSRLQESSDFSSQLSNADLFRRKGQRTAHQARAGTSAGSSEDRGPLVEIKMGSTFQPIESRSEVSGPAPRSERALAPPTARQVIPLPKDVGMEKYSGLRLRRPLVSSTEMERKMAERRLIRLSQLPERLAREKLEESDWVTFAVLVSKATPQSKGSGKTFSIWKLSDLHDLEVYVSLFLFGDVHKEHWKTEPGTVMGILNPNPMKPKDGYDGVSLSVDHPQKVLLMGEAQDFGTCKGVKKNGEPCSQVVNMYECQFCQYHVKAQYRRMSAQRAELQSSFSGKVAGKVKGHGGSLKERLCQTGFHYGGVSSAACAAALAASHPKKPTQTSISSLFIKGSAQLARQALALKADEVSGCSDDFKSLLSVPTPGALQLKKHLTHTRPSGSQGSAGAGVQSISASDLLKQQKQQQQQLLESRRRRAEEIQQRALQNSAKGPGPPAPPPPGRRALPPPKATSEVPGTAPSPAAPRTPTLGRGFSEGEDILFFDHTPPPPPSSPSLSAAKLAALRKLRVKGAGLAKEDPNAVKRKRSNSSDITTRVEKNLASPDDDKSEEEPAQKKRRDNLDYIQSEEFQKILNAKSLHGAAVQAAEYQVQERYFAPLVHKEQMEEKMRGIREMKCRAVTCKNCKYTYFTPADRCKEEGHHLLWHDGLKRFFKCPCGQRAIALDRLPHKHCSNCGLFKWERDGMLKEKAGPKIAGELLQPRGEEQPKFLSSMK